jgi:uncharacterized LabA/DUF88 family protein
MGDSRSIIFIDGENLVFRYQSMLAAGKKPSPKVVHIPDVFVWHPTMTEWCLMHVLRVYFYTSVVGDDKKIADIKDKISKTIFSFEYDKDRGGTAQIIPIVFKKSAKSQKTRQVDIQITIDMMRFAHQQPVDVLYLVSGDGDYLPLISEVMRQGKEVYVGALSSGLNPELQYSVDEFHNLDKYFFQEVKKTETANHTKIAGSP